MHNGKLSPKISVAQRNTECCKTHLTRFIRDDFSDTDDNRPLYNAVCVSVTDRHNVSMYEERHISNRQQMLSTIVSGWVN